MRRSLKSITGSIVIVAAISVGLSGCVSTNPIPVPSRHALVGVWSHNGVASLALNDDGSFTLTDIPQGVISQEAVSPGHSPHGPDLSVSGTWKRGSGGNDAGGAPGVQLEFDKPIGPNDALTMLVSGTDSNRQLYVNLGYPDSHTEYAFSKR